MEKLYLVFEKKFPSSLVLDRETDSDGLHGSRVRSSIWALFAEIQAFGGIVGHTQRKARIISARNAVQDAEKCLSDQVLTNRLHLCLNLLTRVNHTC